MYNKSHVGFKAPNPFSIRRMDKVSYELGKEVFKGQC